MNDGAYPRDMIGYGRTPPFANWPNGARIAVQFVINYEEGGENNILHGDPASEAFLSEIVGAAPWPGMRHMNMESIYEYGSRAGFWRLYRMFVERDLPATVYAVATAMERNQPAIAAMVEAGWEIATHGYKWIDYRDTPIELERDHLLRAVKIHQEISGSFPLGLYQGRSSINTINIGCELENFLYLSDSYADDLPYYIQGPKGPQLIIPYTLDTNDMRFATAQGFNSGDQFYNYLKDAFDVLYAEGDTSPKMLSIGLHCRLVGRPGRAASLARFLDYVKSHENVWVPTRLDIARHWIATHSPPGGWKPTALTRTLFVERFEGIYEHSRWVAERAYDSGLTPAANTAEGLARAMAAVVVSATPEQKRALIAAHPDLAGRLALTGQLTPASAIEQASAGLDQLTEEEKGQFEKINAEYKRKFGFPFVKAVKGCSKNEILSEFNQRIKNDVPEEIIVSLSEINKIAKIRLSQILL